MHPVIRTILQRLGLGLIRHFVVSLILFSSIEFLPGDFGEAVLGQAALPETVAAFRKELGLDLPLHERYFDWLGGMLTGDLGNSFSGRGSSGGQDRSRPVVELLAPRLANTLFLASMAAIISVPLALFLGIGGVGGHVMAFALPVDQRGVQRDLDAMRVAGFGIGFRQFDGAHTCPTGRAGIVLFFACRAALAFQAQNRDRHPFFKKGLQGRDRAYRIFVVIVVAAPQNVGVPLVVARKREKRQQVFAVLLPRHPFDETEGANIQCIDIKSEIQGLDTGIGDKRNFVAQVREFAYPCLSVAQHQHLSRGLGV